MNTSIFLHGWQGYNGNSRNGNRGWPGCWQVIRLGEIMQPFAKQFYKSKAWRECRDAFLANKYGLCERCGEPGLIVHHKIKLTPDNIHDPAVTLNWDNLELLCLECHNREHGGASTTDGLGFDERGNLVVRHRPMTGHKGDMVPIDVNIVWGAPASGKTTYVREHKGPRDLVVDLDLIRQAISMGEAKGEDHLLDTAIRIRDYLYDLIARRQVDCDAVWVIACLPRREQRDELAIRLKTDKFVFMDASEAECKARAMQDDERIDKDMQMSIIDKWFAEYER